MGKENPEIEYREADNIHDTHASMFQIAPSGNGVALYFGEEQYELNSDGSSQVHEVVYDAKVKMTVEGAQELQKLIAEVLSNDEERVRDRGVE